MKMAPMFLGLSVAATLTLTACGPGDDEASAASSGNCPGYDGETITFVVPYSAGGGFDLQARLLAPELEEALGATVVVENREGAGGLLAINELMAARPDGNTIAITNGTGTFGAFLGDADGVQFDPNEFGYVAAIESTPNVVTTSAESSYATFEDLENRPGAKFASVGPGAADYLNVTVLNEVFDLGGELVVGYEGTSETVAATSRGETDAMSSNLETLEAAVSDGSQNLALILDQDPLADYPDVPTAMDIAADLSDEQRGILEAHLDLLDISRPIVTPPGVDEEKVDALRCAFDTVAADQSFMTKAKAQGLLGLTSGEDITAFIDEFTENVPDSYVDVVKSAF